MDVALIENAGDVDAALPAFPPERSLYVAVSARAAHALRERGLAFETEDDVVSAERLKTLGDENHELARLWVERLESALGLGEFAPFRWHYYRLKILLDAVRLRQLILDSLLARERPQKLGAPPACDPADPKGPSLFFSQDESIYGLLASRAPGREHVAFPQARPIPSARRGLSRLINAAAARGKLAWKLRLAARARGAAVFGTLNYDLEALAAKTVAPKSRILRYDGAGELRLAPSMLPVQPDRGAPFPVELEARFLGLARTGSPAADAILDARIQAYAERHLARLWSGYQALAEADRRFDFRAYFHSSGATDADFGLPIAYFQAKKKPVFVVQHGGYGYARNRLTEHCEFGHDGTFLGWGEGVEGMYGALKRGTCRFVAAGSPGLERIRRSRRRSSRFERICYVPVSLRGQTAYLPHGQPFLDSGLFVETVRRLEALAPLLGNRELVVKMAPSELSPSALYGLNPLPGWVVAHLPRARVEARPLPEVIHDYDLIIIDWPSTTLLQACASGAEVLLIENPYHTLTPESRELLSPRAVLARDTKDFVTAAGRVLAGDKPVSDLEDIRFLLRYGLYKDDGRGLERMVAAVAPALA